MKNLSGYIAVLFFMNITAYKAQQRITDIKVNYEAEKITVADAIHEVLSKNKVLYSYSEEPLKKYKVQKIKCINDPITKCLERILLGLPYEVIINENVIIIRDLPSRSGLLQSQTSLSKKDTTNFDPKERDIKEVIINAGYYKVKDQERTGSIAKVTAKEIENQPVSNVLSTVQGRMAGVNITQNSGVPGGGYDVQIRGRNSLRSLEVSETDGNLPLYVVDGMPVANQIPSTIALGILPGRSINPLNSINPNDIESIEVLKDADATAIYGSKGANGVILITTKKGKVGKLNLNVNTSYALSRAISNLKMMNTEQYLNMRRQAFINDNRSYPATAYDINGTWDKNRYTDWGKALIGNTATTSANQITISGGNELTRFLFSMGHTEQTTVFGQGFKYVTNNILNNISHRSKDNKFQMEISNMFSFLKNNMMESDATNLSFKLSPNAPALYKEDGSLNWENNTFTNPIAAYNATYSYNNKQFLTNINLQYELFKNFRLKLNSGINYQDLDEVLLNPNTMYNPSFALGKSSATSSSTQNTQNRLSLIVEPQINWVYKRGDHELDFLVGGSFQRDVSSQGGMNGYGFESNAFIRNISAAKIQTIYDQVDSEYRYAAAFGRINYQYKNRYILNITGRRDGSSRFGPNKKFANFGAVGAAWIFSKEEFLKNLKWLSFGKLRGSYGSAGSDNIGDYQYLDTYNVSSLLIYNNVTGLIPSRLYNPDYSWEKTVKLEVALELGFLNNRLNLTAAWYRNRSSNQLVGYQLPAMTGFSSVIANLPATIQNTGLEIEINAKPLSLSEFQWQTAFNISFPKSKLISFPGLEGSSYARKYEIGGPISIQKFYHLEGIDQNGKYKFTDYNGDGIISFEDDAKITENIGVRFFGGWSNQLNYKNWELSFLIQIVKQKNRNYNSNMGTPGTMFNMPIEVLDVWSPQNPSGRYVPYTSRTNPQYSFFIDSDATVSDASFIRLKNLQIGYKIPLRNSVFREVKIYVQGQNLITWTKYFGTDPEFFGISHTPPMRTFSFGAQFNL